MMVEVSIEPTRIGRYEIGALLGRGGAAEVFETWLEGADGFTKPLVLKRLHADLLEHPEVVEAFRREARIATRASHGNIVQVFDYGLEEGRPYLVLERIDGCSAGALLDHVRGQQRPLDPRIAAFVAREIARALSHVHRLRDDEGSPTAIVHRDVSPANILISRDGVVKLTDFGIAKTARPEAMTLPGVVKGTPRYAAPEQLAGRPLDARCDVYALGVVLAEMLEGQDELELQAIAREASEPVAAQRLESAAVMAARLSAWLHEHGEHDVPEDLATLVREAVDSVRVAPAALDDALLGWGDASTPATRQAAGAHLPETPLDRRAPRRFHAGSMLAALAGIAGLAFIVSMLSDPSPADTRPRATTRSAEPTNEARPQAEAKTPAPDPPHPEAALAPPRAKSEDVASTELSESTPAQARPVRDANEPTRRGSPARPSILKLNVLPWARVSIDGRPRGRTPLDVSLAPGRHVLILENPDFDRRERYELELAPGETRTIIEW